MIAKAWRKWLVALVLILASLIFYAVTWQQLGLDAWHKAWQRHGQLPAVLLPWEWQDPNVLELRLAEAIARVRKGQTVNAENVESMLHTMKTLRPGWPYYLLLEQQWRLASNQLSPAAWAYVLQRGAHEPAVVYASAATLFQYWERFPPLIRQKMLQLLWRSSPRLQSQIINYAFLSSRLFEYCDYGYNTALDAPPDCRKAGWEPLKKLPESQSGAVVERP